MTIYFVLFTKLLLQEIVAMNGNLMLLKQKSSRGTK
jgi:hypothetical protein